MKRVALMLAISALMLVGVAGPSFATDHPDTPNPNADCFSDCPVTPPVIPDPPEPETPVVPDSPYVPEEWNPPVVEDGPPPADIPEVVAEAPPEEAPPAVAPAPAPKPKAKPLAAKGKIAPAAQKCSTIPVGLSEGGFSPWWLLPAAALGFAAGAFTRRRRDDEPVDEAEEDTAGPDAEESAESPAPAGTV